MAAMTGKEEPDGLSDHNRDVVRASLRGIGSPAQAHPEMYAVAYMIVIGLSVVSCGALCGATGWLAMMGGAQ